MLLFDVSRQDRSMNEIVISYSVNTMKALMTDELRLPSHSAYCG